MPEISALLYITDGKELKKNPTNSHFWHFIPIIKKTFLIFLKKKQNKQKPQNKTRKLYIGRENPKTTPDIFRIFSTCEHDLSERCKQDQLSTDNS